MPVQNRLRSRKQRSKNNGHFKLVLKTLFLFAFAFFIYFLFSKNYWKSDRKMVLTIANINDGVRVITLDPINAQINDYFIPGSTEVEVSRGLGVWKLRSVWNLGIQEKIGGGELLTETLTKHANIPTFVYSSEKGYGLLSTNFKSVFRAIVFPYKTNLSLGDRLSIVFFTVKVKNTKRIEVDLSKTPYLTKKTLTDGESGFLVSNSLPQSLALVFADSDISKDFSKFVLNDNTGRAGFSDTFSSVLEMTGGKVILVSKNKPDKMYCTVKSKKRSVSIYLSKLFKCESDKKLLEGNFDVEITIGEKFALDF